LSFTITAPTFARSQVDLKLAKCAIDINKASRVMRPSDRRPSGFTQISASLVGDSLRFCGKLSTLNFFCASTVEFPGGLISIPQFVGENKRVFYPVHESTEGYPVAYLIKPERLLLRDLRIDFLKLIPSLTTESPSIWGKLPGISTTDRVCQNLENPRAVLFEHVQ
jgi:hypothetical protein